MLQTLKNSNGSRQKLPMLLISQNEKQEPGCMCLQSEPYNSTQRHCCQRIKPETHQDTTSNNYQVTRSTGYMRIQQMPQGCCCSLLFSHAVGSDSFQPHGLQHSRLPCPSPSSRAWSNTCALSPWWHPTISSSVVPFSSHLQSFPASGSFLMTGLAEENHRKNSPRNKLQHVCVCVYVCVCTQILIPMYRYMQTHKQKKGLTDQKKHINQMLCVDFPKILI